LNGWTVDPAAARRRVGAPLEPIIPRKESSVKKDLKRVKKLQLHRESLRDLDLRAAGGGALTGSGRPDCSFIYTGCLTICGIVTR
jgi:hypothetical protein